MTIVRVRHDQENPFVMINKSALWDKNLSLDAVGLWARLLSRPDNWEVHSSELAKSCDENIKKIYKILKCLIEHGYCYRYQVFDQRNKLGKVEYIVFETPKTQEDIQKLFPQTQKRLSGIPLRRKRDTTNTYSKEKDEKEKDPPLTPPSYRKPRKGDEKQDLRKKISPEWSDEEFEAAWEKMIKSSTLLGVRDVQGYLETILQNNRDVSAMAKTSKSYVDSHKKQALKFNDTKHRGDRVYACKDYVEFIDGPHYKFVRYDVSDEEWKRETGWD